ncbi:MAG: DUF6326 family protein [Candidatus Hodarchaeales archaeon]|jgi:hypothetical protein
MTNTLEDMKINVKLKLSALWVAALFLFIYADYFGLYTPGHIEDIIAGELSGFTISQVLLLAFMILMTLPSLMVFLSLILKPKVNRWTNIIIGIVQAVFVLGGIADPNLFFVFASSVEVVLLSLIVWYAWTWPTQEA